MEVPERADSDGDETVEDVEIENTEKRLYNGFQGPFTETEESSLQPNVSCGNTVDKVLLQSTVLLLFVFILLI